MPDSEFGFAVIPSVLDSKAHTNGLLNQNCVLKWFDTQHSQLPKGYLLMTAMSVTVRSNWVAITTREALSKGPFVAAQSIAPIRNILLAEKGPVEGVIWIF
jgi:hypothetical protein